MARLEIGKGIDLTISGYKKAEQKLQSYIKPSVYKGAAYMSEKIVSALEALPTQDRKDGSGLPPFMRKGKKASGISTIQKQDIINGFGIAAFENKNGFINVKIGFDGYGSYRTNSFPQGIPNVLVVRSLEIGTDFLKKNSVVTQTVKANENKTIKILEEEFNKRVTKEL
ncbi:hypothetical protein IMSAG250_00718 [Clostridiales bacterium]|nr:hypothetical protein IMSAG250_00718 [Clostridiales bacterium]